MDLILQLIGLFEIIFINLCIFGRNSSRKYSYRITIPVLLLYTLVLITVGMIVIKTLGIYGNGNGLFTLLGFFYLLPLHYLYKESILKQMFIICFCWIYTLIVSSIAMQLGFIFETYGRFLVVVIAETLIFVCTFYWTKKFVLKIYMSLIGCEERGIQNYLNRTSLVWFLTILFVNLLFIFYDNSLLKIATICIIGYSVVFTYKLLYEMLNKRNEIGLLKN